MTGKLISKLTLFFSSISFLAIGQTPLYPLIPFDTTCSIDKASLSHCSCDSLKIIYSKLERREKTIGTFDGQGSCWTSNLYTKDKRISKCGFFNKKYQLEYGLNFIYDTTGKLIKIEEFYQSEKIDECNMQ